MHAYIAEYSIFVENETTTVEIMFVCFLIKMTLLANCMTQRFDVTHK